MKRKLILAVAFICTVAVASAAGANILSALGRRSYTVTNSMQVAGLHRSWEVIAPVAALPRPAPIIVMLSGITAPVDLEIQRDRLIPYVNADMAELVYPFGIGLSWNAIGCCGRAAGQKVGDVAFMKALVKRLDPGHERPIYLVGYSNGGRLAYRLACDDPGVFDAMAVVKAMPLPGCLVTRPLKILQIDALDDTAVAYKPGEPAKESPDATTEVTRLRETDGCAPRASVVKYPILTFTTWHNCESGSRVGFAVYTTGGHNFPPPKDKSPGASSVIFAFFTNTAVRSLPR
jgi:polyhydroxybutyrate depolymerase